MNWNKIDKSYNVKTGILESDLFSDTKLGSLVDENLLSSSRTEGRTIYFVNPYVFEMDNPSSLLLSLFDEYRNDKKSEIKYKYMRYPDYLKSDYWKAFRQEAIKHYGNRCNWCGIGGDDSVIHVHHIKYGNWFHEELKNVILLCSGCHSKAHGKYFKGGN